MSVKEGEVGGGKVVGGVSALELVVALLGGLSYLLVGSLVAALYLKLLVGPSGRDSDAVLLIILTWPAWLVVGLAVVLFKPFLWLARWLGAGKKYDPRYWPWRDNGD